MLDAMEPSLFQQAKLALVAGVGLSKDALHVYFGLIVFLGVVLLTGRRPKSALPLVAVALLSLLGEVMDARDDLGSLGYWRWQASVHDVWNTLFWPVVLRILLRTSAMSLGSYATRSSREDA
jgi:hypothetical protein